MNGEGLVFLARTSTKSFEHKVIGDFIDNRWHTMYVQYNLGNLTLDIDGESQVSIEVFEWLLNSNVLSVRLIGLLIYILFPPPNKIRTSLNIYQVNNCRH